jgi:dihydroorotate dehydrogenase (NAD+) catalytic subunit
VPVLNQPGPSRATRGARGLRRRRLAGPRALGTVDTAADIGSVRLPDAVMTASGTAGHGAELAPYLELGALGAVVVKSLHAEPWPGNPPLRLHETVGGMINSVGLQGPGVRAWLAHDLPPLVDTGARVVASIWGRSVDDYRRAAEMLAAAPPAVVAVEINLSCPNTESGRDLFAHSAVATDAVVRATRACGRPRWAKLSPNTDRLAEVAAAAHGAGAEALTLVNTVMAMAIDPRSRRYRLGAGPLGGGLSGPAIHPVAVRAVFDVHRALPDVPIIGVGGIASGLDAAEMVLAGATAVQVGTATFADPRAAARVSSELRAWAESQGIARLAEVVGAVEA